MKILLLLLFPCFLFSQTYIGRVVKIADGDTFTMLIEGNIQVKVRIHGIDAPERGQPFSQKSKEYLSSMIWDNIVKVKSTGKDRYGRVLGIVSTSIIDDVNLEMIRSGMAWHYAYYDKTPEYIKAQLFAQNEKRGIWSENNPINPYEFRRLKRK